jgi:glutamate synthase domain-containing protein 1
MMCGIAGLISHHMLKENGARIKKGIALQNDRGNGLGAGYAAYGIYPECEQLYALHVMAQDTAGMQEVKKFIDENFLLHYEDDIPVWDKVITDHPIFRRFYVEPRDAKLTDGKDDDYTIEKVMQINATFSGAFVFSSGKNMGVFKGVGTPADIYDFFQLDNYEGYIWLAHNRFPTNTPGWWGGAHPFNLLDWSIVHNGEISSYGINRRYLESFGYVCRMQTDSEVVAYLLDLLIRRHGLSIKDATMVLAPPYWASTERMEDKELQDKLITLKVIYESAMLNGPFAILAASNEGIFSITDNTKLRPMITGRAGDYSYFASEVSALYEMDENLETVVTPRAGQPCVVMLEQYAHHKEKVLLEKRG